MGTIRDKYVKMLRDFRSLREVIVAKARCKVVTKAKKKKTHPSELAGGYSMRAFNASHTAAQQAGHDTPPPETGFPEGVNVERSKLALDSAAGAAAHNDMAQDARASGDLLGASKLHQTAASYHDNSATYHRAAHSSKYGTSTQVAEPARTHHVNAERIHRYARRQHLAAARALKTEDGMNRLTGNTYRSLPPNSHEDD